MKITQKTKIGFVTVGSILLVTMLTFYGTGVYINVKKIKKMNEV